MPAMENGVLFDTGIVTVIIAFLVWLLVVRLLTYFEG